MSVNEEIKDALKQFNLPKFNEIPDVGLYLEQTAKYISGIGHAENGAITGSMISNYVKKGLIKNPVKKQYSREQIAYLIFITMAKSVLSMEDIKFLIELQKETYDGETAYNYLILEFENVLQYVFGIKDEMDNIGVTQSGVKIMLRNLIMAIAHKAYLEVCFDYYRNKCV